MHIQRTYLLTCLINYRKSSYERRDFLSCLLAPWHARLVIDPATTMQYRRLPIFNTPTQPKISAYSICHGYNVSSVDPDWTIHNALIQAQYRLKYLKARTCQCLGKSVCGIQLATVIYQLDMLIGALLANHIVADIDMLGPSMLYRVLYQLARYPVILMDGDAAVRPRYL